MARYFYQMLVSNGKHHVGAFLLPTGMAYPTPKETSIQLCFPGFDPINLGIGRYVHHIMPDVHQQKGGIEPGDFFIGLHARHSGGNDTICVVVEDYRTLSKHLRKAGWILWK